MGARVEGPVRALSPREKMAVNAASSDASHEKKLGPKSGGGKHVKARIADEPSSEAAKSDVQKLLKENGHHEVVAESTREVPLDTVGWEAATAPVGTLDSSSDIVADLGKGPEEKANADEDGDELAPVAAEGAGDGPEAPKVVRTFYLVKVPRPDNTSGNAAVKRAELKLKEKREKQEYMNVALRLKQLSRNEANDNLKQAWERLKVCNEEVKVKANEMRPIRESLRRLQDVGKEARSKGRSLACSTEEELDQRLHELEFQRQHESMTLQEEKKILREIRQLESTREEVRANASLQTEFSGTKEEREAMHARLKPVQDELETVKAQQDAAHKVVLKLTEEAKALNKAVEDLFAERSAAQQEHQAAYEELRKLRQASAAKDHEFYENRRDVQKFRQLAVQKDIKALEEFSIEQVDRLLAKFSADTKFRAEYIKNNEWSTLRRFGCSDGRQLGPDEDPAELSRELKSPGPSSAPAAVPAKKSAPAKPSPTAEPEQLKEPVTEKKKAPAAPKQKVEQAFAVPAPEKKKEAPVAAPVVDVEAERKREAEAKERRRQEEVQKAKEAEERKRKQADRAAAKAAARAAKEEEEAAKRREKDREKKQRKRSVASEVVQEDSSPAVAETAPAEVTEDAKETAATSAGEAEAPAFRNRKKGAAPKTKLAKLVKPKKAGFMGLDSSMVTMLVVALVIASVVVIGYMAAVTDWDPAAFADAE